MSNNIDFGKVRALFFDFDGTLVDSIPFLKDLYMNFLKSIGQVGTEEEFERLNGPSSKEIIRYLKEKYKIDKSSEEIEGMFQQIFVGLYTHKVQFFPGVVEFLQFAKEKGYSLWIVTSASGDLVHSMLQKNGVDDLFEDVISAGDRANGKPHPEIYLHSLDVAQCKPDEVIAFEDSKNGIQSSLAAGLYTIGFRNKEDMNVIQMNSWQDIEHYFLEKLS